MLGSRTGVHTGEPLVVSPLVCYGCVLFLLLELVAISVLCSLA